MATYEEIFGKRVEVLDADPTLTTAYEGQVWYNSTTGTLKSVVASAAWISSTPLITADVEAAQAAWDAQTDEQKAMSPRPADVILP